MTSIRDRLAALLPAGRVVPPPGDAGRDLSRHELGDPVAWVRPRSTGEVAEIVRFAREGKVPVVPVGRRTAYWNAIRYDGAIALDVAGLDAIGPVGRAFDPVVCGAGAPVREVEEAFRREGHSLACHPDAFGDTSVGAMVATGLTSGRGVGTAGLDQVVAGLRVVLGTGEVVSTGAAFALGAPPFLRGGLPDPTGLFLATDGALGVVTEVAVRPFPAGHLGRVTATAPPTPGGAAALVRAASALRTPGLADTFRAVSIELPEDRPEGGGPSPWQLDVFVRSSWSAAERDLRIGQVRAVLDETLGSSEPAAEVGPLWWGEAGGAWEMMGPHRLASVDVNLPHEAGARAIEVSLEVLEEARRLPFLSLRRGLYAAPDHLNLGLHLVFPVDEAPAADVAALVERARARFSRLPIVPYRWGRGWGPHLAGRLDPGYRALLARLRDACDPDGILHPGAGVVATGPPG